MTIEIIIRSVPTTMKTLVNALLLVWFAIYELIFIAIALLTKLNPYVLGALFIIGNGCNIIVSKMEKLSPYERPMAFNSEIYTTALSAIGIFSILPAIVCFFIDWKIALISLAVGLFLGGFVTFIPNALIAKPLHIMYYGLLKLGEKVNK